MNRSIELSQLDIYKKSSFLLIIYLRKISGPVEQHKLNPMLPRSTWSRNHFNSSNSGISASVLADDFMTSIWLCITACNGSFRITYSLKRKTNLFQEMLNAISIYLWSYLVELLLTKSSLRC